MSSIYTLMALLLPHMTKKMKISNQTNVVNQRVEWSLEILNTDNDSMNKYFNWCILIQAGELAL